ncbi:MAG: flagellar hook-associated protein FlgK [Candidatus Electryonea clarkiae]|nr:flagellar hook-associated protein FlgK [Candidatus Electryonea clarkiae]MDP8285184.1 flagellar hook-associated protein FlgK [Candidatus Electryonea clarkiae]
MNQIEKAATVPLHGQMKMTRDSLIAIQRSMGVIANNVSNLDTEGYHRQLALLEDRDPMNTNPGMTGSGLKFAGIERMIESYAENQMREESSASGRWEAQRNELQHVEEVFSEINSFSISGALDEFWDAWQDLANDVDSVSARTNVLSKAQNLAYAFHETTRGLERVQESINLDLGQLSNKINTLAANIAAYNQEIITSTNRGQSPNTFMDKRDLLIQELSSLTGATVQQDDNGSMTVYIGNEVLVHREEAREVGWLDDAGKGKSGGDLIWSDSTNLLTFDGGSALGKLNVRDEVIPEAFDDLNLVATTLRDRINDLHSDGIGMDKSTGNAFWREDTVGSIDLEVNSILINNPEKVAASRISSTGDNSLANDMYELQYEQAFVNGRVNFSEFYQGTVSRIGNDVEYADTRSEASQAALEQAENYQQQISGVNLDEEMANMLAFNRTYTASGRMLMKLDEMTTVILMMAR